MTQLSTDYLVFTLEVAERIQRHGQEVWSKRGTRRVISLPLLRLWFMNDSESCQVTRLGTSPNEKSKRLKTHCEPQCLLEWFADKYKEFGATHEFVTNQGGRVIK